MTDPNKNELKEQRKRGQRSLFINVLLMFLVSIVVFVIGTYYFVIPRLITQNSEIAHLRLKLIDTQQILNELIHQTVGSKPEPAAEAEKGGGEPPRTD